MQETLPLLRPQVTELIRQYKLYSVEEVTLTRSIPANLNRKKSMVYQPNHQNDGFYEKDRAHLFTYTPCYGYLVVQGVE